MVRTDLGRNPSWFPAAENRDEGVFVQLDADASAAWQERPAVHERLDQLAMGHDRWQATRRTKRDPAFFGPARGCPPRQDPVAYLAQGDTTTVPSLILFRGWVT